MELVRFQIKPPDDHYGSYLTEERAVDALRKLLRAHKPGGFEIHRDHRLISTGTLDAADAVHKLEDEFGDVDVGSTWRITETDGAWELQTRKIRIELAVIDTRGNRTVDAARAVAIALGFANGDNGTAVCKTVGSTATLSQHNPWKSFPARNLSAGANAIDLVHNSHERMTGGARFFAEEHERYRVHTVIHWLHGDTHPSIWTLDRRWHEYVIPPGGSDHRDHYHVDFDPQRGPSPQGAFDAPDCP